jgi:hypothetical protein
VTVQPNLNLLDNPGIETNTITGAWDDSSRGFINVVNSEHPNSGNYAVTVCQGSLEQIITVSPNTNYRLSAWAKIATAGGSPAYLGIADYGFADTGEVIQGSDYKHYSLEFKTGATTTSARVFFWSGMDQKQVIYGDDFELVNLDGSDIFSKTYSSKPKAFFLKITSDMLSISAPHADHVVMYTTSGARVKKVRKTTEPFRWCVSDLSAGVYVTAILKNGKRLLTKKVIIK